MVGGMALSDWLQVMCVFLGMLLDCYVWLFFAVWPSQERIRTGSKCSHEPVKQFRFLKQSLEINQQIPDYEKFSAFSCKIKKISQKN